MPSISSCPDCHRDLTVPDSESAADVLRCPLCGSEFPAERILADSVRFPPLAVVVRSGNSLAGRDAPSAAPGEIKPLDASPFTGAPPESVGGAEHGPVTKSISAAETRDALPGDRSPAPPSEPEHFDAVVEEEDETGHSVAGIDLTRLAHRPPEQRDDVRSGIRENSDPNLQPRSDFARSQLPVGAQTDLSRLNINQGADSTDASSGAAASDDADAADSESDTVESQAAAAFDAPIMRVSTQPRPRGGGLTAVIAQFVGVVVGGAMGLAIGYYILLWLVGAKADVLELRTKLPSWLVPPIREQHSTDSGRREQNLVAKPFAETADKSATAAPSVEQGTRHDATALGNDTSPLAMAGPYASVPDDGNEASAVRASFDQPFSDPFAEEADEHASAYTSSERHDETGQTEAFEQTLPREEPVPIMLGPRNAPMHSFEELEAALERAGSALRCSHFTHHRLSSPPAEDDNHSNDAGEAPQREAKAAGRRATCELCRGSGIGNLTTGVFEELCQLAESLTFVRIGGHEDEADALREATAGLLRSVGESRSKCDIVGRLAAARLANVRRSSNGVLLAGTVSQAGWEGDLFTVRLILAGVARPVTVLGRDAPQPALEPRDRVLILGSIIENADDNVAGYLGDVPQVVWGGMGLKIPTRE